MVAAQTEAVRNRGGGLRADQAALAAKREKETALLGQPKPQTSEQVELTQAKTREINQRMERNEALLPSEMYRMVAETENIIERTRRSKVMTEVDLEHVRASTKTLLSGRILDAPTQAKMLGDAVTAWGFQSTSSDKALQDEARTQLTALATFLTKQGTAPLPQGGTPAAQTQPGAPAQAAGGAQAWPGSDKAVAGQRYKLKSGRNVLWDGKTATPME